MPIRPKIYKKFNIRELIFLSRNEEIVRLNSIFNISKERPKYSHATIGRMVSPPISRERVRQILFKEGFKRQRKSPRSTMKLIPPQEEVIRLGSLHDVKKGKPTHTLSDIAKETGYSTSQIVPILKKAKIERDYRQDRVAKLANTKNNDGKPMYTVSEIAEKTGYSPNNIYRILKNAKIKRLALRGRKPNPKTEEIIRLGSLHNIKTRKPTYTLEEIGRMTEITKKGVSQILKKAEIERDYRQNYVAKLANTKNNDGTPMYTVSEIAEKTGYSPTNIYLLLKKRKNHNENKK
ncbi:MAG: hypothetical protein V1672_04655 [Candidatus Diapherotrites archaeon]